MKPKHHEQAEEAARGVSSQIRWHPSMRPSVAAHIALAPPPWLLSCGSLGCWPRVFSKFAAPPAVPAPPSGARCSAALRPAPPLAALAPGRPGTSGRARRAPLTSLQRGGPPLEGFSPPRVAFTRRNITTGHAPGPAPASPGTDERKHHVACGSFPREVEHSRRAERGDVPESPRRWPRRPGYARNRPPRSFSFFPLPAPARACGAAMSWHTCVEPQYVVGLWWRRIPGVVPGWSL
jgi:hypothetical protein